MRCAPAPLARAESVFQDDDGGPCVYPTRRRPVFLQRQTLMRIGRGRRVRWGARAAILRVGTLAISIAGGSIMLGRYGGLSWLVLTVLIYIEWSFMNAWMLVVQAMNK